MGARVDDAGTLFVLLQSWWKGKQFVEVSEAYLHGSEDGDCSPSSS